MKASIEAALSGTKGDDTPLHYVTMILGRGNLVNHLLLQLDDDGAPIHLTTWPDAGAERPTVGQAVAQLDDLRIVLTSTWMDDGEGLTGRAYYATVALA